MRPLRPKSVVSIVAFSVGIALAGLSAASSLTPKQTEVVNAEREFAGQGLKLGMQKAFLAHYAPDNWGFHPYPTSGIQWYQQHPDRQNTVLIWRPEFVAAAASGDMGLSIGPWRYESRKEEQTQNFYGHFMSVWRRNSEGVWQVVIDQGVEHGSYEVENAKIVPIALPSASAASANVPTRLSSLKKADADLREALAAGNGETAYSSIATGQTVWLRDGNPPLQSSAPAKLGSAAEHTLGTGPNAAIAVSRDGSFGYSVGGSESAPADGIYVRVWSYSPQHGWQLTADYSGGKA